MRITRARSIRTAPRNFTLFRISEEGISSDTRDQSRKGLCIASSTPPALSLSKVLNSRNSVPRPLMPRTKTGMARESRAQWRRSFVGADRFVGFLISSCNYSGDLVKPLVVKKGACVMLRKCRGRLISRNAVLQRFLRSS